jgi:hypothetical protein
MEFWIGGSQGNLLSESERGNAEALCRVMLEGVVTIAGRAGSAPRLPLVRLKIGSFRTGALP